MLPPQPGDLPRLLEEAKRLQESGDLAGARAGYKRILLAQPKAAAVWFQLGRVEFALGDARASEVALRKALALAPRERAVWQALHRVLKAGAARKLEKEAKRAGIVLGAEADLAPAQDLMKRGAFADAEAAALSVVKTAPDAFWPALILGEARAAQGKWASAVPPLKMAMARNPASSRAALGYGRALARLGQRVAAAEVFEPLAASRWDARVELAQVYAETLDLEAAHRLFEPPLPAGKVPWQAEKMRAEIAAHRGDGAEALSFLSAATVPAEHIEETWRRVAYHLREAGAFEAADLVLRDGLGRVPGASGLKTDLAQSVQSAGDAEAAASLLWEVIEADPTHAEAYRALAAGQKARNGDPLVDRLQDAIDTQSVPRAARRTLLFAAAKVATDLGQTATIFEHLDRANRLMREAYPYRFEDDLAEARRLVGDWDALMSLGACGPADPALFVTGLPRSGTTLVEMILAAHPQVGAGGEMPFLSRALSPAMERLRAGEADAALFAQAGTRYLEAARRRSGSQIFTDKAISTFSRIGHTLTALPGARIVVLRRDPRDVGLSMYRNMFPEGLHRYTTDLAAMGRYIRLHEALVSYWSQCCPESVHIVDYEALTADPEPNVRALVAFAGLEWDDACLAPEKSARRVETLSFMQVRAPIGQGAVAGWRQFASELAPLIESLEQTEIDLFAAPTDEP